MGETQNHFKKEINALVELVIKRDPKMERYTDLIGAKLAGILQKPEQEMQMMLRRTHYLNKKKEKKLELDKCQQMIKLRIEQVLKQNNRKGDSDIFDLADLKPNFKFQPELICKNGESEELKLLIGNFVKELKQFIAINDLYCKAKHNEEKAKVRIATNFLGKKTKSSC